ncbi:oxysterol-binding protein related protein [Saccharomycopsis crataegensis]|uniref:Oxysterol-binding protein related protein n=1 Tax=Saccharomycopsis crataegensis TaxID=43959 RepID=A0AAV5QTU9_9ASCO|nr:oxysterol-binding protein related protein [Saccharomycopsis crataegensis]
MSDPVEPGKELQEKTAGDYLSNAPLLKLKLLEALKNVDCSKVDNLYSTYDNVDNPAIANLKSLVLHLAIQVSSFKLFEELLANKSYKQFLNYQDENGNTPLHIACQSQRHDIIELLLNQPLVNDTILNHENQQPIDLIKNNPSLFNFVQLQRVKYVEKVSTELRKGFTNRDFKKLNQIYSNPRNFELLDINGLDPESGDTVLHEFIKKKDVEMVQWILSHGGDPFKRDKRGKLPVEIISKLKASGQADQLKKILKKASKEQSVIDPVSNTQTVLINSNGSMEQAPTFKGYLKKWTNFASGYKLRWFILDSQGILSYYKNQDDINSNCRGSINLKNCRLHLDSSEKLKFEILGVHNANIKWHLKGNHSVETNRWVWAISNAIKFAKDREKAARKLSNTKSVAEANIIRNNTDASSLMAPSLMAPSEITSRSSQLNQKTPFEYTKAPESHLSALHEGKGHSRVPSNTPSIISSRHTRSFSELSQISRNNSKAGTRDNILSPIQDSYSTADHELEDDIEDNGSEAGDLEVLQFNDELESISADSVSIFEKDISNLKFIGPHGNEITILQKALLVEMNSLSELVSASLGTTAEGEERRSILETSANALQAAVEDYRRLLTLIHKNNFKIVKKLNNELNVNGLWESSIKELEEENIKNVKKVEQFERERRQLRKILREKLMQAGNSDLSSLDENELGLRRIISDAVHDAESAQVEKIKSLSNNAPIIAVDDSKPEEETTTNIQPEVSTTPKASSNPPALNSTNTESSESSNFSPRKSIMLSDSLQDQKLMQFVEEEDTDSDSDDEFFDFDDFAEDETENPFIDETSNNKEVEDIAVAKPQAGGVAADIKRTETADETLTDQTTKVEAIVDDNATYYPTPIELNTVQEKKNELLLKEKTYNGYEDPIRTKLSKDEDDRPKISLWGILKSMIGKDMTKITLPVSFNECTSLLQRVAEGVEYTELIDKAASIDDSTLRLCYVAAFGSSEYASTLIRVAKPFNPLLGETFEYARPDKNFRFFVEQVSHHPPISAALAESPKWDYYGESAVKSKFNGRSFDIKPLGKWYLHLRPDKFVKDTAGNKIADEEIITWNRVTSSVVGIIVGNPVVDNYGEMKIVNHTTGDHVTLEFKARGWRASSAYEVKGTVYNKNDEPCYAIKGHWDSKIYCRKLNKEGVPESDDPNDKFLLWQVNPRPKRPFNLTLFSISLNALQPHLKNWLAPTDTRLRPDQRAMEDGRYDDAADEKNRVEEKQRAARKMRETSGTSYKTKFFDRDVHPITKENYWKYNGTYWKRRGKHDLADSGDIF